MRETEFATKKLLDPLWLAVTVHVPAAIIVSALPESVQISIVDEVRVTGNPDVAVPVSVKGESPKVFGVGKVKVMVWVAGLIRND